MFIFFIWIYWRCFFWIIRHWPYITTILRERQGSRSLWSIYYSFSSKKEVFFFLFVNDTPYPSVVHGKGTPCISSSAPPNIFPVSHIFPHSIIPPHSLSPSSMCSLIILPSPNLPPCLCYLRTPSLLSLPLCTSLLHVPPSSILSTLSTLSTLHLNL